MKCAMPILDGRIEKIWFDDGMTCSSRLISANVRLPDGKVMFIEEIRDDLENPEPFDEFWNKSKQMGFENLLGRPVRVKSFFEGHFHNF